MSCDRKPLVAVIDGQGGGIGKAVVEKLKKELPTVTIRALGTNSIATGKMMKAGADDGATGENAVALNALRADVIVGVVPILMPNGILGELTPRMAEAIGESEAVKILIPVNRCNIKVATPTEYTVGQYIDRAVELVRQELEVLTGSSL